MIIYEWGQITIHFFQDLLLDFDSISCFSRASENNFFQWTFSGLITLDLR